MLAAATQGIPVIDDAFAWMHPPAWLSGGDPEPAGVGDDELDVGEIAGEELILIWALEKRRPVDDKSLGSEAFLSIISLVSVSHFLLNIHILFFISFE